MLNLQSKRIETVSQSKRVRALNVNVICAYVDVVYVVDLNSKLQIECIRILYVCMLQVRGVF